MHRAALPAHACVKSAPASVSARMNTDVAAAAAARPCSRMDVRFLLNGASTSPGAGASTRPRARVPRAFAKRRAFACTQCGFVFGMRSNLKRHIATVHEAKRSFACHVCHAAFGLKQNLATHVRVKHEKQRPFRCAVCRAAFGYKQVLQNHRRNIHGHSV